MKDTQKIEQIPGIWIIKDKDLRYTAASSEMLKNFSMSSQEEIIGKSVRELPSSISMFEDEIEWDDRNVFNFQNPTLLVSVNKYGTNNKIFLVEKTLIKPQFMESEGILCRFMDITNNPLIAAALAKTGNDKSKFDPFKPAIYFVKK